jgi:phospholipase C
MKRKLLSTVATAVLAVAIAYSLPTSADQNDDNRGNDVHTATPIKHLVVIFNENRSFDHYFGTYPNAGNPIGEIPFKAKPHTPNVNNYIANPELLVNNPNLNPANGTGATNPFRLDRTQANTADQGHGYTQEQEAYDNGKADLFPKFTGRGSATGGVGAFLTTGQVMGYFDGNTVTALWNYAQNFAMNDNAYTDTYGPSTPGALEVVSGQTNGAENVVGTSASINDGQGGLTLIGDTDPAADVCSSTSSQVQMTSANIGDLLNKADISWGGFMGGFNLELVNANGSTGCKRSTLSNIVGTVTDYVPHHAWLQYFKSSANPTHARPSSVEAIGHTFAKGSKTADPANHDYDLEDFFAAVEANNFPAVSFIKQSAFQDGHPGNSDPLDEQAGIVDLINFLQQRPEWKETAVIITYDDSDGWYDHAFATPTSASYDPTADQVNGPGQCGRGVNVQPQPDGLEGEPVNGRCGPGTRIPFLVISPFAKQNFVSHTRISQASVVRFIEDNWLSGERLGGGSFDKSTGSIMDMFDFKNGGRDGQADKLFLDPGAGIVMVSPPPRRGH